MIYGAIALVVSIVLNGLLWHLRDSALTDAAKWEAAYKQAGDAALACSSATEDMQRKASARNAAAQKAVAEAAERARQSEAKAQGILSTAPADPKDACKSAVLLSESLLALRRAQTGRSGK